MFELLKQFFAKSTEAESFTQQEKEALIELLLMIKFADKTLTAEENDFLVSLLPQIGWDSPVQYDNFIGVVIAKLRDLTSDALISERVEHLVSKIDKPSLLLTLKFSENLALSDGNFSEEEKKIISKIAEAASKR